MLDCVFNYSYYHVLKVASAFKTFPVLLPPDEPDEGLELAVRRRRTKSLFTEEHLRKKLVSGLLVFFIYLCQL